MLLEPHLRPPLPRQQSYQKKLHQLQLSEVKTQRLKVKNLINQNHQQINTPQRALLLETPPPMLSLLKMLKLVPKTLELHQNTSQLQYIQLKQTHGKKLDSPKNSFKEMMIKKLRNLKLKLINTLVRALLLETILLMLSQLNKSKLVPKTLELNQNTSQHQSTQL